MRSRFNPLKAIAAALAAFRADLIPGSRAPESHRDTLGIQVRQLAAIWPLAFVVAVAAPAIVWWSSRAAGLAGLMNAALLWGGVVAGLGLVLLMTVGLPPARLHGRACKLCPA